MPGSEIDFSQDSAAEFRAQPSQEGRNPVSGQQASNVPPAKGTVTSAQQRAFDRQANIGAIRAKPRVKTLAIGRNYKPSGTLVQFAQNKVGVMPNLDAVVREIAQEAGVDLTDEVEASRFIDALVTDVYVNAYSDKQAFDGEVSVAEGSFVLPRRHIKTVIEKYVNTNYRRFARAMAETVVQVMHDNEDFAELLDKRCGESNLSTRAEAVRHFDGADALAHVDRDMAHKNAVVKTMKLSKRAGPRAYAVDNSAVSADGFDESGNAAV